MDFSGLQVPALVLLDVDLVGPLGQVDEVPVLQRLLLPRRQVLTMQPHLTCNQTKRTGSFQLALRDVYM